MLTSFLFNSLLPQPLHAPAISDDEDYLLPSHVPQGSSQSQSVILRNVIPPYGQRKGWKPSSQEDYGNYSCSLFRLDWYSLARYVTGDGGAYPECHIAQYPLEMGRKKVRISIRSFGGKLM